MSKFSGLALAVEKPERMPILHPVTRQPLKDGQSTAAYIDLHSNDSDIARKHDRAVTQRRINMRGRAKLSAEELESDAIDRLAWLTAGWHLVGLDGSVIDVTFSRDNAVELYAEPAMSWLREQAEDFVNDRSNFAKASSSN